MKDVVKAGWRFFKRRVVYETLLYPYGIARHRALLKRAERSQSHLYTCFYRSPGQLDALTGPVMRYLLAGRAAEPFQIHVFACSLGAEAYTIAAVLRQKFPSLDFHISASDLHQEVVDQAAAAIYTFDQVHNGGVDETLIAATFDQLGPQFRVRDEIRDHVTFHQASLLDSELRARFGVADIVFAQNVLFHLSPPMAHAAFRNVAATLKPKSALFIDGMELDMRATLTAAARLTPLDYRCRDIHDHARTHVNRRWWNYYYGAEPYAVWRRDRLRRYSTIFFQEVR